ncbi:hypothetical protein HYH02_006673 [Chlamydomonas schloesseri]|uniref:Uncharacterized protein n=1 Tax=Chlamydomonas schloesseri TaxID=2026947 RepID=A0A835W0H8_9CHLO|nr:hypothetical protein HYH02_006673 [Chlamydomonas schloesseri]|eukprot:KAG2432688.1 hypothetical protein HYH02_006673 [Chlamydomonas schloesseri]
MSNPLDSPGPAPTVTWLGGGVATVTYNLSRTVMFDTQSIYLCIASPTVKADFFALNVTGNGTVPRNDTSITTYRLLRGGVLRSVSYADASVDPLSYKCGQDSPQILFYETWPRRTPLGFLTLSMVVSWRAVITAR